MKKFILFYRENTQRLEFTLLYFIRVFKGCCLSSSFQGIKLNKNFIFYVAFLLSLFSQSLIYSQITIDGNPNDWPAVLNNPANTKKAFKHDPFDILHIDDQWTGGSSDTDVNPSLNWFWVKGNSNDKGDVANAGAVLLGTKLYFFGDRTATNGDAQIGFWFFLDNVQPIGTGDRSSPFTGQHTNGDILIISNFVNGGGKAKPLVYVWTGKTSTLPGGLVLANPAVIDAILGTNPALVNVPTGQMYNGETWSFYPKFGTSGTYPSPLFFEGYVDLATLPGGYNACFQRFLLETRNSQSLNASLQDLVSGGFSGVPPAPSVASNSICGNGSVSLTASGCNNGILKWYSVPSGGSPIGVGTPFNTPIINQTTTYYVSCTIDGCEGPRSPVVATINLPPTGIGVPTHVLCNGASTGSIDLTPSGGIPPYTYAWTKVGDVGFNASTQDLSGLSAGVYNVVITDSKGCDANTQVEITEPPLLLPDISKNPFNVGTLCGVNSTEAQANVNTAFNNWLNEAGPGYENGVLVTNPGTAPYVITREPVNPSAPLFSGGVTQVTWTITDACGKTDVVTETFTVNNNCRIICETIATPVVCYGDSSGSLAVTGSGGFPPYNFYLYLSSDLTTQISSVLGVNANPGMTTFSDLPTGNYTILITDSVQDLDDPTICPDTFISEPTALELTLVTNSENCSGPGSGSIEATFSGGTPPYLVSINGESATEQSSPYTFNNLSSGGYSINVVDANGCEKFLETKVNLMPCNDAHCTYTQGFYGNVGGLGCTPNYGTVNSQIMMINALNQVGGSYNFGSVITGNYFLLKLSDINGSVKPKDNNIYKMLPGGGTPRALFGFATYDTFSTWSDNDPLNSSGNKKGAINNNLLSQTMTLFFNMQVDPTLGGTQLQANFATAAAVQCGSNIPNMETIQYFTISQNIINYLNLNGGANIANLFNLANKILGGETVVGITASNVNAAVDSINKGYDECRINVTQNLINIVDNTFVKDNNIKLLKSDFVVYPVPFKDNINIKYLFDSDSVVEIQIFDMKGALVFKYKDSEVYSGKEVNLNLPFKHAGGEIYFIKMITNQETIIKKIVSNN